VPSAVSRVSGQSGTHRRHSLAGDQPRRLPLGAGSAHGLAFGSAGVGLGSDALDVSDAVSVRSGTSFAPSVALSPAASALGAAHLAAPQAAMVRRPSRASMALAAAVGINIAASPGARVGGLPFDRRPSFAQPFERRPSFAQPSSADAALGHSGASGRSLGSSKTDATASAGRRPGSASGRSRNGGPGAVSGMLDVGSFRAHGSGALATGFDGSSVLRLSNSEDEEAWRSDPSRTPVTLWGWLVYLLCCSLSCRKRAGVLLGRVGSKLCPSRLRVVARQVSARDHPEAEAVAALSEWRNARMALSLHNLNVDMRNARSTRSQMLALQVSDLGASLERLLLALIPSEDERRAVVAAVAAKRQAAVAATSARSAGSHTRLAATGAAHRQEDTVRKL